MNRRRLLGATSLLLLAGRGAADESAWRLLDGAGWAVLLRHAQTVPGIGDPPGFRPDDCSTQRNLSEAGREQAKRFGAAFVRRGVRIDEVLSSRWCRCLDTAALAFPQQPARLFAPLDSFFADGGSGEAQTAQLRRYLAALGPARRVVMVTHMVNIAALTGQSAAMGEALVVRTAAVDVGSVLGRLTFG